MQSFSDTAYELQAPLINGTFVTAHNFIYWDEVAGADYYRVYGLEFEYDGLPGLDEPYPRDPKKYKVIGDTRELSYRHETTKDFVYSVRAFSNDGKSSNYSGIIFTEEWVVKP